MSPLARDVTSLQKRQKALFTQLYEHIDSLVKVVEDAASSLAETPRQSVLPESAAATSSDGNQQGAQQEGGDVNRAGGDTAIPHGTVGATSAKPPAGAQSTDSAAVDKRDTTLHTNLTSVANAVKKLDVHRNALRICREFKANYTKFGKPLVTAEQPASTRVFLHDSLDEELVVQMIGMHLLHYGLFDVYDELKSEIVEVWGEGSRALVSEAVISAYVTLHRMISQYKNEDIQPLVEWVKQHKAESHLHADRFDALLLNLHKLQLMNGLYVVTEGETQKSYVLMTPERISRVRSSGLSHMWDCHNRDIGKLMTQVILGENLPTPDELAQLKVSTERMFVKLFCENGIRVKKPPPPASPPDHCVRVPDWPHRPKGMKSDMITSLKRTAQCEEKPKPPKPEPDPLRYPVRGTPETTPEKPSHDSWLELMESGVTELLDSNVASKAVCEEPERKGTKLQPGWLRSVEGETRQTIPFPRINYERLRSPVLSQMAVFYQAKRRMAGIVPTTSQLHHVDTLKTMLSDPETACRQLIPKPPWRTQGRPIKVLQGDTYSPPDFTIRSEENWYARRVEHAAAATALLESNDSSSDRVIRDMIYEADVGASRRPDHAREQPNPQADPPSDSLTESQPTVSFTLFTGSPVLRDILMNSQITRRSLTRQGVASGLGRIRIRFPSRSDPSEPPSHGRRTGGRDLRVSRYEPGPASADASSAAANVQGEGFIGFREAPNVNVRGLLRMIMRSNNGHGSQNGGTAERAPSDAGTVPPSLGIREDNAASVGLTSGATSQPSNPVVPKSFQVAYEREEADDFVRVFLPYESPISVLVCAGYILNHRLAELVDFPSMGERMSSELSSLMRSSSQLPIDADLGPAFCFHSYLTCPISKDQTCGDNPPVMLPCGHVTCRRCADSFSSVRRKGQFKCPMCPQLISPGSTKVLHLDWNSCGLDAPR